MPRRRTENLPLLCGGGSNGASWMPSLVLPANHQLRGSTRQKSKTLVTRLKVCARRVGEAWADGEVSRSRRSFGGLVVFPGGPTSLRADGRVDTQPHEAEDAAACTPQLHELLVAERSEV